MRVICFDLDDTLYKELDFLKSAYREIATFAVKNCSCSDSPVSLVDKAYDAMLEAYYTSGNAFERLNAFLDIDLPITEYLKLYRAHVPGISLSDDVVFVLDALKSSDCIVGLITDGRSIQQRNKIKALRLDRWITDENIVISEEFGTEKPNSANYEYFMKRYPKCTDFTYVGDNLKKDFIAPNELGWMTVCLKDNGRNVHVQDFSSVSIQAMPRRVVANLKSMLLE